MYGQQTPIFGQMNPQIARVAEETVLNLKELETRLETLKQALAQVCMAVGHPQAAQIAVTPVTAMRGGMTQGFQPFQQGIGTPGYGGVGTGFGNVPWTQGIGNVPWAQGPTPGIAGAPTFGGLGSFGGLGGVGGPGLPGAIANPYAMYYR